MKTLSKYAKFLMDGMSSVLMLAFTAMLIRYTYSVTLSPDICDNMGKIDCPLKIVAIPFCIAMAFGYVFLLRWLYHNLFREKSIAWHAFYLALPFLLLAALTLLNMFMLLISYSWF